MKKTGLILIALLLLAQAAAAETFGWDEDNNGETFIGLGMGFKGGTLYTLPEPGNLTSISATIHSTMSGNQIISAAIYDSNQELIAFTDEYTVPISGIDQILADMPFSETISLRPGDYYLLFGGDSSIRFGLDMAGGTSTLEGTYAYDWHNNISDFRNFGPSATVKIVVYGNYNLPVAATPEIVSVEGNPVNGVIPHFSSANDGDLTIRFTALNSEGGGVTADLNYSAQDMQGTGTAIATGLMLNGVVCEDDDFSNETSCSIEWDISGVEEGNYFLGLGLDNWAVTGFDASENSFAIDATGPEATVTKMNEEEVAGVLLSFNAEEDDNITINFDMLDAVGGNIVVDVNYSLQNIEGTGFVLEKGLALDAIVCKDADFTNSTECNVHGIL